MDIHCHRHTPSSPLWQTFRESHLLERALAQLSGIFCILGSRFCSFMFLGQINSLVHERMSERSCTHRSALWALPSALSAKKILCFDVAVAVWACLSYDCSFFVATTPHQCYWATKARHRPSLVLLNFGTRSKTRTARQRHE